VKKALFLILFLSVLIIFSTEADARLSSKAHFIKSVDILFLKGNYSSVAKDVRGNIRKYRFSTKEKKKLLYLAGLSHIKLGGYESAIGHFQNILDMKGSDYREDAYIGIADSYFYAKNYSKAIESYNAILTMYPRSDRLSSVYHNLALSYEKVKRKDKAKTYYKKVKNEFNTSFEAKGITDVALEKDIKTHYYIVQIGAFRSLRNAKKLVRRLSRKGFDSYIQKIRKDRKAFYRVRGGKFSNKDYAVRLVRKLRRNRFSAKIIME